MRKYKPEDIRFIHRSHEYEEMMEEIPPIFVRWGTSIILALIFALIGVATFVKYPEVIKADALFKLSEKGNYNAYICINEKDMLNIKNGQKVLMKLYAYPSEKYGIVSGFISSSRTYSSVKGKLLIGVRYSFPAQIKQNIIKTETLNGQADIILKESSLLERIILSNK